MTLKGALDAHARDELGISIEMSARPVQAALTSGLSFSLGTAASLALVPISPATWSIASVPAGSVIFLGALAMSITAGVGKLFSALV